LVRKITSGFEVHLCISPQLTFHFTTVWPDSSVWSVHSDYQAFPDDGSENFYEGVRKIHGITHPDITTPMNGKDSIPTHLVPNNKSLVSPIISNRRYIAKMEEFLSRKSSSSSSSVKFDIVNNQ